MIDTDHLERAAARLLAAPLAPPPPVHLVQARAARLRHRRRRAAAVATSAVVLVVVLLVAGLVTGGRGDGLQVRTVRPAGDPPQESGAPAPSAPTASPGAEASEPTRAPGSGDARAAASPSVPGDERAAPAELPTEGCRVAARPTRDDSPLIDPTGAEPGDSPRRCSFTATEPGGYEGGGTWTLDVVRDGRRTTYDSLNDPPCADEVIRPGDTVYVQLGLRAADTPASASASASASEGEWHLAAGSFAHC